MATFRPPKERIESLIDKVMEALKQSTSYEITGESEARGIIRNVITENLREEYELEVEVEETLRNHAQTIYTEKADFGTMMLEGKKRLAKKKGFIL